MKKVFIAVLVLICVSFMLYSLFGKKYQQSVDTLSTMTIGSQKLRVEIANTVETITKGLSDRETLGSDGLLFVMPTRAIPSFWMKDMHFDLDFVWIDGNTVVDISENVRHQPNASLSELKVYAPKNAVSHVLEMNAGEVKKRGIKMGDTVSF